MKTMIKWSAFLFVMTGSLLLAQTPPSAAGASEPTTPWVLLAKHNDELLQALKKQDTHQIHELSEGLEGEAGGLASKGSKLPADEQEQFQKALKEIAEDAGFIHKAAHRAAWDEALAKQVKLAEAIQKITVLMSGK